MNSFDPLFGHTLRETVLKVTDILSFYYQSYETICDRINKKYERQYGYYSLEVIEKTLERLKEDKLIKHRYIRIINTDFYKINIITLLKRRKDK